MLIAIDCKIHIKQLFGLKHSTLTYTGHTLQGTKIMSNLVSPLCKTQNFSLTSDIKNTEIIRNCRKVNVIVDNWKHSFPNNINKICSPYQQNSQYQRADKRLQGLTN